ncbi:hypothetical protein EHS25_006158 [Saitozyma podzolica]|uniref:Striatin N-terminal domain-containing protein n=1 Tax=Saitozyma podzolica TaxID=1890683 RepID=A0A427XRR7_9TREE|nr:hypothetical protein EHS25_006158 [Saitozyma podzolica]
MFRPLSGYPPSSYQSPQQQQLNGSHQGQGQGQAHGQGGGVGSLQAFAASQGGGGSNQPGMHTGPGANMGGMINGGATTDGQSNSASGGAPEMNLASVLHFLQSEWRRWERDRNEWEIERAEMRARIALLEGQRRSAENLKVDLLRRVKMLEYALRQERTRTVSTVGKATSIAPSRLAALQDEDRASSRDEREGSASEGSEDGGGDRPRANGIHPAAIGSKMATLAARPQDTAWKNIASVPKDPKSRARSREYLKQCLQEITYLTSPGALNPLPAGPPISVERSVSPAGSDFPAGSEASAPLERPRKVLAENPPPSLLVREPGTSALSEVKPEIPNGASRDETPASLPDGAQEAAPSEAASLGAAVPPPQGPSIPLLPKAQADARGLNVDSASQPPSSPLPRPMPLPEEPTGEDPGKQILTAIYRPDSKAAWREELRAANEQAEKAKAERSAKTDEQSDEEQLASLTFNVDEEDVKPDDSIERVWTSRRSLKSHLDIVRAVAFGHGPGIVFASAGDDCSVKVWSVESAAVMLTRASPTELEPILTLRGHLEPVTSLVISTPLSTIFSASIDSTIRVWRLPPPTQDPYAAWDPMWCVQTLEGHTDSVWDLCLLPPREIVPPGKKPSEGRLVSSSADGTVKLWRYDPDVSPGGQWKLSASWNFEGNGNPTCLGVCNTDFAKVLIGFYDGTVKVWDVEEGVEVQSFGESSDEDDVQVNAVLSHPTLPAIITAQENGRIRFFDAKSSSPKPTHTILGHPAAINGMTISPLSPMSIITASVDCTLRVWDLSKKTSVQDLQGHRSRAGEGVVGVASHPELPIVASAGADGVVRLWAAT